METPLVSPVRGDRPRRARRRGRPRRRRRGARGARRVGGRAGSTTRRPSSPRPSRCCSPTRRATTSSSASPARSATRPTSIRLRSLWLVRRRRRGRRRRAADAAVQPHPRAAASPTRRSPRSPRRSSAEDLPGVVGAVPEVEEFAELWAAADRRSARGRTCGRASTRSSRSSRCRPRPGRARVATADDRELALRWWIAFGDEVLHEGGPGRERAEATLDHRLSSPVGRDPPVGGRRRARLARRLGRPDAERHPHRPRLHAAGAARPRLRDRADRRAVAAAARRPPLRGRPPLLLPLHRPREPDLERDLRADRLPPRAPSRPRSVFG